MIRAAPAAINSTSETTASTGTTPANLATPASCRNSGIILQQGPLAMTHKQVQDFKITVAESGSSKSDSRWRELVELLLEVGGRQ
jgi:hypothetical protein